MTRLAFLLGLFVAVATAQEPPTPFKIDESWMIGEILAPQGTPTYHWSDGKRTVLSCKTVPEMSPEHWFDFEKDGSSLYDCKLGEGVTLDGAVRLLMKMSDMERRQREAEVQILRERFAKLSKWRTLPEGKFLQ